MTKAEAIELFDSSVPKLSETLGITRQAVYMWPDELSQQKTDEIIGAALRTGRLPADGFPNSISSAS